MNLLIAPSQLHVARTLQAQIAAPREEKTASGIGTAMLSKGTDANPKASDTVKVRYRGTLEDGPGVR